MTKRVSKKKTKASGTRFEYRVMHYLQDHGWIVYRSAGSHSCADLIGYRKYDDGSVRNIWVQCKAGPILYLSPKEKQDLVYGYTHFGVTPLAICRTLDHKMKFWMWHSQLERFVPVKEPKWLRISL